MKHIITLIILTIVCFSGCSRNVPLSGKITFEDNGEPLKTGTIGFVSGNSQARADIDAEGNYTLGFQQVGDGMPKGEYKIYIHAVQLEMITGPDRDNDGLEDVVSRIETPLIAEKYKSPETSGLVFNADGKTQTFNIKIERAK